MLIEIKNRWNDKVLYSHDCENNTMKLTLLKAVAADSNLNYSDLSGSDLSGSDLRGSNLSYSNLNGSNLSGSNLRGSNLNGSNLNYSDLSGSNLSYSDLSGSDLRGSDLSYSDLSGSNLSGSDLRGSDLRGSNLRGSNLSYSDLSGSDLSGSDLRGSDLSYSDLSGSNLSGSNLNGSNLRDSDLTSIRDDIWAVLSFAPAEVPALIQSIKAGKIDGSMYTGDCACLVGTIANVRHVDVENLGSLKKNSSRPAERFFLGIKKGDTSETSQFSKLALEWCEEWLSRMTAVFGSKGVI